MLKTILSLLSSMILFSLVGVPSAGAEIYQWKDREGRLHFAQDLSRVPPQYRAQAENGVLKEGAGSSIQQYRAPSSSAPPSSLGQSRRFGQTRREKASGRSGQVHRIQVGKTGSSMRVLVRLNDAVDVPFILDTGASDVVVPAWAIEKMGVDLSGARKNYYQTANGVVEHKVLVLESVALGSAKAESVPAAVSPSMSVGLLGLSFFNHFRYNIDPVAGIVTLEENGLAAAGRIRGGRSEAQWRHVFQNLNHRIEQIEDEMDKVGSNRSRRRAEFEALIEETERQIEVLEDEADEAHVPMSWRD